MKVLAFNTFVAAIALSCVGEYFSVIGLAALFAATTREAIVMGCALAYAKLSGATWLKANWKKPGAWLLKIGLSLGMMWLMVITSWGIYSFLWDSYAQQKTTAAVATVNITPRETELAQAQAATKVASTRLDQLDAAVQGYLAGGYLGKSAQVHDTQAAERSALTAQIMDANAAAKRLTAEIAGLSIRALETGAKLGPAKSIATILGFTDQDAAVRVVIMALTVAFEPMVILLLMAATATLLQQQPTIPPRRTRKPKRKTAELILLNSKRTVA